MEEEANNKLAFLDVQISRNPDGSIDTEVYRKTTSTDRILHESNHPNVHKVSCIRTLFGRIDTHCSTRAAKAKERAHLYRICTFNGYSKDFIQRCITPRARQPIEGASETSTWRVLPYIQGVSETAARILATHGVKVAHKPDQTLRKRVMRPKEALPKEETSSIIYRINCSNCASHYVGETSKRLKTRVHEHKLAVRRNEQRSQIWMHMEEHGHEFNFQETEVVAHDETKGGRLLKEAWYSNNNSLNRHIDMPPAYQALRHQEGLKEDRSLRLHGDRGQIPSFKHRNWPNEGVTNPDSGQENMLGRQQKEKDRGGDEEEQRRPITRSWAKQMGLKEATCEPKRERHNNEGEGAGRDAFKAMPDSPV